MSEIDGFKKLKYEKLQGNSVLRPVCGHLLLVGVLYGMFVSLTYNISLLDQDSINAEQQHIRWTSTLPSVRVHVTSNMVFRDFFQC